MSGLKILSGYESSVSNFFPTVELTLSFMSKPLLRRPGPSCSKLTTSLVNVSLNFQKLISRICQYFLLKKGVKFLHYIKLLSFFSTKNFRVSGYKVVKHLSN